MAELSGREKATDFARELREKNKEINSIDFNKAGIKRFRNRTVTDWAKAKKETK